MPHWADSISDQGNTPDQTRQVRADLQQAQYDETGGIVLQLATTTILKEIKTSGRLPSPTGVALTILELTRDPDTSTEDMAAVLVGDPSLTGQILKYANAADNGPRGEITNINDALVRLGMSTVRQLCLGFSVLSNSRSGPCPSFDYGEYWTQSLAMAVSSQSLCRRIKSVSPDEAFTCGLLGNIGHLALASIYPDRYGEILEKWDQGPRVDLLEIEENILSINHNSVSAALFEDWGLPDYYGMAVEIQENQEWSDLPSGRTSRDRGHQLGRILNIARLAAEICLETGPQRHPMVLQFMEIGKELGINENDWNALYDEILEEWERLGKLLNIVTSHVPTLETLVRRAREFRGVIPDKKNKNTGPDIIDNAGADSDILADLAEQAVLAKGMDILIVTDSPVDMRILEKKLTAAGHRLTKAVDGQEALEMALKTNPQVILTDWMMPRLDGLELTRSLRQTSLAAETYMIIMTAQEGNQQLMEAFESGIDDYVVKPINHGILNARLKAATRIVALQERAARHREEVRRTINELGILSRQMHTMALEDQLTKLPNRRCGLEYFDKEWSRSTRNQESLLCMIMDIDHFKNVNDTYGHDAGDVVLQSTAAVMKAAMRDSDVVCRFGGEEFLVICPGADVEVAKIVGNRVRKAIQDNVMDTAEFKGNVTISIGVAVRNDHHTSPKDLIKEADEALYAAKEAGRNMVCIAD